MIASDAARYGPFKVYVGATGKFFECATLVEATAKAHDLMRRHRLASVTLDARGVKVGSTEEFYDGDAA